jgi:hypothetical protein
VTWQVFSGPRTSLGCFDYLLSLLGLNWSLATALLKRIQIKREHTRKWCQRKAEEQQKFIQSPGIIQVQPPGPELPGSFSFIQPRLLAYLLKYNIVNSVVVWYNTFTRFF